MSEPAAPPNVLSRFLLLHPVVLVGAVWLAAFATWATASGEVLEASHIDTRAGSLHAFVVVFGCLAAFAAGSVLASLVAPRSPVRLLAAMPNAGFATATNLVSLATIAGGAIWFLRISLAVGGPGHLLALFRSGLSVSDLKTLVFVPAELPPLTTLVHFAPAAASMLMVQRRLAGWSRRQGLCFLGVLAVAGMRTLLLSERLAGLGVLAAVAVTWLFTTQNIRLRTLLGYAGACAAVLWLAWSAGEFSRSYMNTHQDSAGKLSLGNFVSSLEYSQIRLGAYVFTAVNNGLLIIDHWPGAEFPGNSVPTLSRLPVPGLQSEGGGSELYTESILQPEFTGVSMPGALYLDARELAVVLALIYGIVFGLAWRGAALGSPAGIVLYAALSHVLLDSYRSAYLFDLQGLAAFAAVALLLLHTGQRERPAVVAGRLKAGA